MCLCVCDHWISCLAQLYSCSNQIDCDHRQQPFEKSSNRKHPTETKFIHPDHHHNSIDSSIDRSIKPFNHSTIFFVFFFFLFDRPKKSNNTKTLCSCSIYFSILLPGTTWSRFVLVFPSTYLFFKTSSLKLFPFQSKCE